MMKTVAVLLTTGMTGTGLRNGSRAHPWSKEATTAFNEPRTRSKRRRRTSEEDSNDFNSYIIHPSVDALQELKVHVYYLRSKIEIAGDTKAAWKSLASKAAADSKKDAGGPNLRRLKELYSRLVILTAGSFWYTLRDTGGCYGVWHSPPFLWQQDRYWVSRACRG